MGYRLQKAILLLIILFGANVEAAIQITAAPQPWVSPWAYFGYGMFTVVLIVLLIYVNRERLKFFKRWTGNHQSQHQTNMSADLSQQNALYPLNLDDPPFNILVVSNDAINLETLQHSLSLQSHQLIKVESGEKAMALLLLGDSFDLLMVDVILPSMSGFELCQQVRQHWPIQELPLVLLSNRYESEDLVQCFTVGANDCISKHISASELSFRVANQLKMLTVTRNLKRIVTQRTAQLEDKKIETEKKIIRRTEDLEQSNRSLAALSEICSEISAILDWDKLLLNVYQHINELMDVEMFWIGLYHPSKNNITFELAIEDGELLPRCETSMDEKNRPAVWCIEHETPLIINDLEQEFSFYFGDLPIPEPQVGKIPLSLIYWPLTAGGRILGVISVQSFHKNAYAYSELEVIRIMASTTAIALDNARAYREVERQKDEVEAKVLQRTQQLEQKNQEILATQQQLVQSEKMASLGTLTAGVAHEINNPTNFVHVSAQNLEVDLQRFEQFILDLAGENADEEILESLDQHFRLLHEHINTISDGTTRIKTIVKDLRAFTHLNTDEKQLVRISDTLMSTINLTKTQFMELAEVTTELQQDAQIRCYPAQLSQVFMNLIVNACDAIKEKQSAKHATNLEQGRIHVTLKTVDKGIEIVFADNGAGMSEATQNKLFEPFYTTKGVGEGTGLGLSISYNIVKKHQGLLKVSSALGRGSEFTLFLPIS